MALLVGVHWLSLLTLPVLPRPDIPGNWVWM
jgi:hypothetical protein